jgi:tetratricopeptide (TPR) repeat protein
MLLGTALSQISDHTLRKSEYEKAVVEYRAAVGLRPDWAAPHSALANLFWSRGNMKPAREEAREAYRLDPTNPGCRMTADRLEWGQGIESHWNEATAQNTQQSYEKFIKKYPQSNLAVEAKQRNSNPDYAFLVTCHLRSEKAVQG